MIVSKLNPGQDGSTKYIITQGSIVWSNDSWYMNPINALWIQIILSGAKDWLKCRKAQNLDKKVYNFQFMNTLSNLVKNIDHGFNSEIKMAADKVTNQLQSRSNRTAIKLLSHTLSEIIDGVVVPEHFFENADRGFYVQFIFRESEKIKHSHLTRLSKMALSKSTEDILLMLKHECNASNLACDRFLAGLKKKTSQM